MAYFWLALAARCGPPPLDGAYVGVAGNLDITGQFAVAVLSQGICSVSGQLRPACDHDRLEVVATDGNCEQLRLLQPKDTYGYLVPMPGKPEQIRGDPLALTLPFASALRLHPVAPGCSAFASEMQWVANDRVQ